MADGCTTCMKRPAVLSVCCCMMRRPTDWPARWSKKPADRVRWTSSSRPCWGRRHTIRPDNSGKNQEQAEEADPRSSAFLCRRRRSVNRISRFRKFYAGKETNLVRFRTEMPERRKPDCCQRERERENGKIEKVTKNKPTFHQKFSNKFSRHLEKRRKNRYNLEYNDMSQERGTCRRSDSHA